MLLLNEAYLLEWNGRAGCLVNERVDGNENELNKSLKRGNRYAMCVNGEQIGIHG